MRSWRSRGSSLFGSWVVSLLLLGVGFPSRSEEPKQAAEPVATLWVKVTLSGITSYEEFREIRAALSQAEGVERVSVESEAPGLITLGLRYAGEPKGLIEKLNVFFSERFTIKEKHLSSRTTEIVITRSSHTPH